MRALVYTGPNAIAFGVMADPAAQADDVLVGVEAVGICGSDMHAYHGFDERRPPPLVLGHEAAGRILDGPRAGQRVAVDPLVTCGHCGFCRNGRSNLCRERQILSMPPRQGAFAERVRVPERNLVPVPDGLDIAHASLAEPLAVAWHAARQAEAALHRPLAAARCVVLGGGAIGLATALALAQFDATVVAVIEPNALRRGTVAHASMPAMPDAAALPADGADVIVDAVGNDATRAAASRLAAPGGVIVHVGLLPGQGGLDVRKLTLQEVMLVGSYCYTHEDFVETVAAIVAGRFGVLGWVEQRPLSEGAAAFADLDRGAVAAAKIVLRP